MSHGTYPLTRVVVARRGADRSSYPYRPDYLTMNRRVALAGIGATVAGLGAWRLAFGSSVAAPRELQEIDLEQILRLTSVPSLAVATVDGERLAARAVGVLQRGGTARATADTPYAAASLTKGVVAYAALALVHDGALVLDRPVHEYLSLPNADDARAERITARHLLSHSGGWRNWRFGPTPPLVADFEPGSRWSYSGEGFFFLQRVLERITGQGIGTIVRERVLTPLGMARSAMLAPATADPSAAIGHDGRGMPIADRTLPVRQALARRVASRNATLDDVRVDDADAALRDVSPETTPFPVSLVPNAAASLMTTANDFARFLRHLVTAERQGGAAAAIVREMMTPQVRCNETIEWGLGIGLESHGTSRAAWQWGDNPGFKNFCFADPATGTAMVVFTNGDRGARVYERVIRATTGRDRTAFLFT